MTKVEIYTKAFCPYCHRAKALFAQKAVDYVEYDITMGGPSRLQMIARASGHTTVPQIFIDGGHIGGCDDVVALDRSGALDSMLMSK